MTTAQKIAASCGFLIYSFYIVRVARKEDISPGSIRWRFFPATILFYILMGSVLLFLQ